MLFYSTFAVSEYADNLSIKFPKHVFIIEQANNGIAYRISIYRKGNGSFVGMV